MLELVVILARRAALVSVALAPLWGCAVGPDFQPPAAPEASGYSPEKLPAETVSAPARGGEAQRFVQDRDIPGQWWTLFQSAPLDALIQQALAKSPTLEAAKAALRQAKENLYAEQGAFYPSLTGNLSATREKVSTSSFGFPGSSALYSVSTASLNVSYPLDVFGGTRRAVEAYAAAADYQRFELAAAYLSLTTNLVNAAVQEASLRGQIAANAEIIAIETHQRDVLQQQLALGGVAGTALLAQEATLAQAKAALPPLQKQLAETRNQLAVYAGRMPSEGVGAEFDLSQLHLPQDLPVSLPSRLVAQRPDILASEAQLHQASAEIGVATANEFPQITLTGSFGSSGSPAGNLFQPGTSVWSIGGSLAQKIFDGGTLLHQRRAAVAAYDQAAAQYRNTVLTAFQDIANTLTALQSDADALAADVAAEQAADRSLAVSRQQFQFGAITYTALLTAEQTDQQTRIARVQAEANRYADTAALFLALGGGWWNAAPGAVGDDPEPAKPDPVASQAN